MSVLEYGRVPYLSEKVLRDHKVYEQTDDRFRSAARARQALLREQKGWDVGLYPPSGEAHAKSAATSVKPIRTRTLSLPKSRI